MQLELAGKCALITGGSQGIGLACAQVLAEEGCNLILVARTAADLTAAQRSITETHRVTVEVRACDLSASNTSAELAERFGPRVDILINNAGAVPRLSLLESDDGAWRKAWDLKVYGCIGLTREIYRHMRERSSGVIINIAGIAGESPNPRSLVASSGNAALMAFSCGLGAESVDYGIRVVGINPGIVETARGCSLADSETPSAWDAVIKKLPFGRMARPREVGDLVAFLASARASYISGTIVTVDGGSVHRR